VGEGGDGQRPHGKRKEVETLFRKGKFAHSASTSESTGFLDGSKGTHLGGALGGKDTVERRE